MGQKIFRFILTSVFILISFIYANENNSLQKIEELLITFKVHRGDILFPDTFEKINRYIGEFKSRQSENKYDPDLEKFIQELEDWTKRAELAREFLAMVLESRDRALQAGAEDFAGENLRRGEEKMQEAARIFANSKASDARTRSFEAIRFYNQAEAEAIRNSLLGQVRILIQESKDIGAEKLAPRTYDITRELLNEVESIIELNDFDNPELTTKADRLSEEARHLLRLVQLIDNFQRGKSNFEIFLLQLEEAIVALGSELEYNPTFSDGLIPVLADIRNSVANLRDEYQQLQFQNQRLVDENQELKKQLQKFRQETEIQEALDNKIRRITANLKNIHAEVAYSGNLLSVRINNFRFDPGRTEVPPRLGPALSEILDVIKEFPKNLFIIKFVQRAPGNHLYNQNLALKRAESIKSYLQAHLLINDAQIEIIGESLSNQNQQLESDSYVEFIVNLNEVIP